MSDKCTCLFTLFSSLSLPVAWSVVALRFCFSVKLRDSQFKIWKWSCSLVENRRTSKGMFLSPHSNDKGVHAVFYSRYLCVYHVD